MHDNEKIPTGFIPPIRCFSKIYYLITYLKSSYLIASSIRHSYILNVLSSPYAASISLMFVTAKNFIFINLPLSYSLENYLIC